MAPPAEAEEARSVALGKLRERGRGAVLVGVARLDTALGVLLAAALAPPRGSETLLHADRPLGSFGAKIALAARLGLIDPAVEQSLHNLRRLRNGFAHSTTSVRLADPPYRDRLQRYANENALDEAWVYGLIRQESRFISHARSSAADARLRGQRRQARPRGRSHR